MSQQHSGPTDILLIEDSPTIAELFAYALQANKSRATLRIVQDAEAALALLLDGHPAAASNPLPLPRLVVLDLHLPTLNGLEALDRLRGNERTRQLPVVIYSASDRDSDRAEAMRRGANGFVRKPVGFKDACAAVARIEREWLSGELSPAFVQPGH
jgi:CheY-like chemotaxis protein